MMKITVTKATKFDEIYIFKSSIKILIQKNPKILLVHLLVSKFLFFRVSFTIKPGRSLFRKLPQSLINYLFPRFVITCLIYFSLF